MKKVIDTIKEITSKDVSIQIEPVIIENEEDTPELRGQTEGHNSLGLS